jgi:2-keto-3-deoxy-L-rhamnonate aldolase RhmA
MRINTTKAKLAEGKVVFGAIISRNAPDLVELFGAIGYDFVMIDCEHGPMSLDEVEHMVRAAEVFGITPITRIPNHEDSTILRFLDRGVQGIIVPHVNTREAAEAVARAARYYPEGHRGVGGGRAHDYGVGVSREESTRWINAQLLVIPMIEEMEAVNNLEAILTVPGVDVLHVASGDLGQSMGNPGAAAVRQVAMPLPMRLASPSLSSSGLTSSLFPPWGSYAWGQKTSASACRQPCNSGQKEVPDDTSPRSCTQPRNCPGGNEKERGDARSLAA